MHLHIHMNLNTQYIWMHIDTQTCTYEYTHRHMCIRTQKYEHSHGLFFYSLGSKGGLLSTRKDWIWHLYEGKRVSFYFHVENILLKNFKWRVCCVIVHFLLHWNMYLKIWKKGKNKLGWMLGHMELKALETLFSSLNLKICCVPVLACFSVLCLFTERGFEI